MMRERVNGVLRALLAVALVVVTAGVAQAQEQPVEPGTPLPVGARVMEVDADVPAVDRLIMSENGLANIMLIGFWPPTNEMLRQFSTNPEQNPDGWVGENYLGRGFNVYAFFPEFPDGLGKGVGDFEVDYQDVSNDFWPLVEVLKPSAVVSFGRAGYDYDWELEGGHRMYELSAWSNDYLAPYDPTPELPIADEIPGTERMCTLPMDEIIAAVEVEVPELHPYRTTIDTSRFVCNYTGYHAIWYNSMHAWAGDPAWNVAGGHVHVGSRMTVESATRAAEVTVEVLIDHLLTIMPKGDSDHDGLCTLEDATSLTECLSGPDHEFTGVGCLWMDMDGDGDVDISDTAAFQRNFGWYP
jgi:hypothetical protein